jgi:hypothetical protein
VGTTCECCGVPTASRIAVICVLCVAELERCVPVTLSPPSALAAVGCEVERA